MSDTRSGEEYYIIEPDVVSHLQKSSTSGFFGYLKKMAGMLGFELTEPTYIELTKALSEISAIKAATTRMSVLPENLTTRAFEAIKVLTNRTSIVEDIIPAMRISVDVPHGKPSLNEIDQYKNRRCNRVNVSSPQNP